MSGKVKVVFIHHTSTITSEPCFGDLSMFLDLLERRPDVQYTVAAWDDPLVDWASFTHFFVTSDIMYVSQLEDFLSWLDGLESSVEGLSARMFNSPDVIRWNSSKKYLRELESRGVRVPLTVWLESESDAHCWGAKNSPGLTGDVVVKNVVDESGYSAWRCRLEGGRFPPLALERLQKQLAASNGRDGVMVQAFMEDILTEGEWSLLFFCGRLSHAVLKSPNRGGNKGDFRVQMRHGGGFSPVARKDIPPGVAVFGEQVLAALPFPGNSLLFARVDVVRSGETPYLMELELLDPYLYLTEPEHADVLLNVFMQAATGSTKSHRI